MKRGLIVGLGLALCPAEAHAQLNPTNAQAADEAPEEDQGTTGSTSDVTNPPTPLAPWRGTALKWSQAMTTTMVGLGNDNQSGAAETYTHGYWALLNYYVYDEDLRSRVRVASSPGFDVEYTNSDTTTDLREPQMRDLNLTTVLNWHVYRDDETRQVIQLLPNLTFLFPTSEPSRKTGTYLVTSPRLTFAYSAPFLPDVDPLASVYVGAQIRWDHRFSEATEPVSADVASRIQRPGLTYSLQPANNLNGTPWAHDTVTASPFVWLVGFLMDQPFAFYLNGVYTREFLYTFSNVECVDVGTGNCLEVTDNDSVPGQQVGSTRTLVGFTVQAQYSFSPEFTLTLGYRNLASAIGPDGLERSPFYSPAAAFTTELIFSIDAIFDSLRGAPRTTAFFLPG